MDVADSYTPNPMLAEVAIPSDPAQHRDDTQLVDESTAPLLSVKDLHVYSAHPQGESCDGFMTMSVLSMASVLIFFPDKHWALWGNLAVAKRRPDVPLSV